MQAADKMMEHLFGRIFSVVKKVRTKTKIGEAPLSVSHTAVKIAAEDVSGPERGDRSGHRRRRNGPIDIRNLVTSGVSKLYLTNRTFQRAVETAEQFKGIPIMFHELNEYLPKVEIVISSITTQQHVLDRSNFSPIAEERKNRPLVLIDISVPRSIDPSVGDIAGVRLYNIDDLQSVATSNVEERKKERCSLRKLLRTTLMTFSNS